MKLFSQAAYRRRLTRPISAPFAEGLDVFPYVRGRLVFAELATRLLESEKYDRILVDLPHFMNHQRWLEHPVGLFPLLSLAVFKNMTGSLKAIPFAPNDAACISVHLAMKKSIPYRCVDDSDLLNYPEESIFSPEVAIGDDYRILHAGLSEFFEPIWEQMDRSWPGASEKERFFTEYRAVQAAKYVRTALRPGGRTLIVCEYQFWWSLRRALPAEQRHPVRYLFRWHHAPAILRVEDPYFAWIHDLLDDYPAASLDFWKRLNSTGVGSFDKLKTIEKILGKVLCGKLSRKARYNPNVSLHSRISFVRYLKKLAVSEQRLVPEPGRQLFHSALACGGPHLQRRLADALLAYPSSPSIQQINFILQNSSIIVIGGPGIVMPGYEKLRSFFTGKSLHCPTESSRLSSNEERIARSSVVDLVHNELTEEERRELDGVMNNGPVRWALEDDFILHEQACSHAHSLALSRMADSTSKRSWGPIEGGMHWRSTLAARARGEDGIYIKHQTWSEGRMLNVDAFTPVVFLLAPEEQIDKSGYTCIRDSNITQRNIDLANFNFAFDRHPAPDMVYSVFITLRSIEYLSEGHIQEDGVTSLSLLYSRRVMGLDRYDAITSRSLRFQCRTIPPEDKELRTFPLSQMGVAWAVKYASNLVIIVAPNGWDASGKLQEFSRQKGVRLLSLPLSAFRADFVDRLGRIFFLSTSLKNHPRKDRITRRFVH